MLLLVLSAVLIGLSFLPNLHPALRLSMQIASAVLSGYELLPAAWEGLKARRLDENLLVLISVLAAFIIGEGAEAAVVSLFFRVGESLEDFAVAKSKRAIEKLYDIQANTATLLNPDGSSIVIPAEDVQIGDILLVSPFDKIPVDCEVLEGAGTADASAITGEALPVELTVGSVLHSGTVNGSEMLKIRATAAFYDSAAAKIIRAVEHSASEKGSADKFITKFAKYYTPAVVGLAVLLALIPSLIFGNPAEYIHRALVFLVASCPCALVLSVPLGFFSAVGAASKLGVIVKGGKYIELLSKTEAILFDKTGTLTDGSFEIEKIVPANGCLPEDILSLAARADRYSTHPLAKAIVAAAGETDENGISDFHETPGKGTSVQIDGEAVLCGSASFLKENGVSAGLLPEAQIYVAKNGEAVGCIALCGRLRESAPTAIRELSALSVNPIILLTGDNETAARQLSEKCGISQFRRQVSCPSRKRKPCKPFAEAAKSPPLWATVSTTRRPSRPQTSASLWAAAPRRRLKSATQF